MVSRTRRTTDLFSFRSGRYWTDPGSEAGRYEGPIRYIELRGALRYWFPTHDQIASTGHLLSDGEVLMWLYDS